MLTVPVIAPPPSIPVKVSVEMTPVDSACCSTPTRFDAVPVTTGAQTNGAGASDGQVPAVPFVPDTVGVPAVMNPEKVDVPAVAPEYAPLADVGRRIVNTPVTLIAYVHVAIAVALALVFTCVPVPLTVPEYTASTGSLFVESVGPHEPPSAGSAATIAVLDVAAAPGRRDALRLVEPPVRNVCLHREILGEAEPIEFGGGLLVSCLHSLPELALVHPGKRRRVLL